MSPTINPGDLVEIDTAVISIPKTGLVANESDGVYLLDLGDGISALRRIERCFGRKGTWWYVSCDRTVDQNREAVKEKDLRILGRAKRVANIRAL